MTVTAHVPPAREKISPPPKLKPRYDLISPQALEALALVLAHGAAKHGENGWLKDKTSYRDHFRAEMGHALEGWRGIKADQDTGLHPWAHAMCRMMFLLHYELTGEGTDDR